MDKEIETRMMEFMRPLFGDMAHQTIENQKEKLGIADGELTYEQYLTIAESIKDLCNKMAGSSVADRIYSGLIGILEAEKA